MHTQSCGCDHSSVGTSAPLCLSTCPSSLLFAADTVCRSRLNAGRCLPPSHHICEVSTVTALIVRRNKHNLPRVSMTRGTELTPKPGLCDCEAGLFTTCKTTHDGGPRDNPSRPGQERVGTEEASGCGYTAHGSLGARGVMTSTWTLEPHKSKFSCSLAL